MANTLESIMRLTDQYTATMSKIINSAQQGEKATENASKGAKTLGEAFRNIQPQTVSAATGITGITGKLATMISTVYLARKAFGFLKESIQTAATQQIQQTTLQSLMGNKQLGTDLYQFVSAYASKSALDRENLSSATTSFLAYTKNINQLQQLLDLTQRLYLFNPAQGAEGAVFALKEVLSGQTMSLRNRFNMTGISADTIQKNFQKGDIAGTISYLDKEFNKFGATQGVVDANFKSLSVQAELFKTNLMSAIGDQSNGAVQSLSGTFQQLNADMDAGKFQPFFNVMAQGTQMLGQGLSWIAQNAYILVPAVGGVVTALVVFNSAMMVARTVALLTGTTVSLVAGQWITAAALIAGAAATIGIASSLSKQNDDLKKSAATLSDVKSSAAKFAAEQKKLGASTLGNSTQFGSIPTTINNKDPIKVSGTVEIEKENLKYVFEASAAKFFATFNAQKIEPSVNIANQTVNKTADLDEVDGYLGNLLAGRASASAGGKML
ncbi:hypothetical protein EQM14_01670 [Caproiciproducens sp. NJN-50]|uniref:hypothetical protein n=1 Tax=Caproiciproducens sp. NJN-50 TaxID=2507162 RepID=UPI000FFE1855|nr:hypothetical protein [Caproiciproducens sp. NJN-50]QAT48592.1 hypothetical protein EQM14_01670 [Caproiciproducens sp. NJN-50]